MSQDADYNPLLLDQYMLRRKLFTIAGAKFQIFDSAGNLVMFCKQKAFKLKEDIRLFSDESQTTEMLAIKARSVIDFGAAYDVEDSTTGEAVGSLRRKGLKSMFRDEWHLFDARERQIGTIKEDSAGMALLRRFTIPMLFPQTYHVEARGKHVATFKQNFNPFVYKLNVDFRQDPDSILDPRLGLAAAVLLAAIEGKQN